MTGKILIAPPRDSADHDAIADLVREYAGSLGFSLDYQNFEAELADLATKYGPPGGALLLARVDGAAAGTVALRELAAGIGEMKRLYVRPDFRMLRLEDGNSIGRALAHPDRRGGARLRASTSQAGHNRSQNGGRHQALSHDGLHRDRALLPQPGTGHRLHGAGPLTDRFYEDFNVGDRFVSGGMTVTEAAIIDFAASGIRSPSTSMPSSPPNGRSAA